MNGQPCPGDNTRRHHLQSIYLNDALAVAQSYGLEVILFKLVNFSFGFLGGVGSAMEEKA